MPPLRRLPLRDVRLLPGPFASAQRTGRDYLLALDPDRLLAPFLREAGLPTGAGYGNWEADGLDGHIAGHALSACALQFAASGDEASRDRMETLLDGLQRAQEAVGTGYLGGVPDGRALGDELARGEVDADLFSLNGRWVPLYNLHKTFAGLLDAAQHGGSDRALVMATAFADWWLGVARGLDDSAFEEVLHAEFGGMNDAFAELADLVGPREPERAEAYRAQARRFSHRALLDPLLDPAPGPIRALDGMHANTQIPKVVGYARLGGDLLPAARRFWTEVVDRRSAAIGGNSVREHFHPSDDFGPMIEDRQGPETCNSSNMVELGGLLLEESGQAGHLDVIERILYNHLLSAQHPEGGFVYFTPLRPSHYRVYSRPEEGMWCCVGSGLESAARAGELVYLRDGDDLVVGLYLPSTLHSDELGVRVRMETDLPFSDEVTLTVDAERPIGVRLRVPAWAREATVLVDGEPASTEPRDGFLLLPRLSAGRHVVQARFASGLAAERLPDGSAWTAYTWGPVVLAARGDSEDLEGLFADGERMAHVASGPLRPLAGTPVVTSATELDAVTPLDRSTLTATLRTDAGPVLLEPFAGIHAGRYTVYWPVGRDPEARRSELAALDRAAQAQAAVVDSVAAGEQQPESDHGFEGSGSRAGGADGIHWRSASGAGAWFGYALRDVDARAAVVRVRVRTEGSRAHEVRIDGAPALAPVSAREEGGVTETDYPIVPAVRVRVSVHTVSEAATHDVLSIALVAADGALDSDVGGDA